MKRDVFPFDFECSRGLVCVPVVLALGGHISIACKGGRSIALGRVGLHPLALGKASRDFGRSPMEHFTSQRRAAGACEMAIEHKRLVFRIDCSATNPFRVPQNVNSRKAEIVTRSTMTEETLAVVDRSDHVVVSIQVVAAVTFPILPTSGRWRFVWLFSHRTSKTLKRTCC